MAVRPSLSCASTQARAPASSSRDSSPSPLPSSYVESSSSIYVTFKVLQLVSALRKKVTRKQRARQASSKKPTSGKITSDDFCQGFDKYAAAEIDKYLGRKTRHPVWKKSGTTAHSTGSCPPVAIQERQAVRGTDELLQRLDHSVRYSQRSITSTAKSNRLFLQRQDTLTLHRLNVKELCELLDAAKGILKRLEERRHTPLRGHSDDLVIHTLDDTQAANLVHLLLRLQGQLIRLLVSQLVHLVQQHVNDCQRDQSKHSEDWFFEFPDARHPQTTTFPWTIKASLVVLWGVCWMFEARAGAPAIFDKDGNLLNERGEIEAPAQAVYAYLYQTQPVQQQQESMQATVNRQALAQHQTLGDPRFSRSVPHSPSAAEMESSTPAQPLLPRGLSMSPSHHSPAHHHTTSRTTEQAPHAAYGLVSAHTNTPLAYSTQPASAYVQHPAWPPLPQDANLDFSPYGAAAAVEQQTWQTQSLPVQSYPAPHLPAHSHFPSRPIGHPSHLPPRQARLSHPHPPPSIITTDPSQFPQQQQPEDFHDPYSATSVSTNSSVPLRQTTSIPNFRNSHFDRGHLSPHSPYMADAIQEVRDMQTTTPPRSPHDMQIGEPMARKRSHSQISNGLPFPPADGSHGHSHHGSQMGDEEFEANRMQPNRPEPLMNDNRKYMCNLREPECAHLIFDRKCEWSKHMDKHDRPYRCANPACAKLQGFTYSGGLLRHEREVHGKHGGPKSQMMCPFPDCKRHSGKGFTRKENLNEHIRRVHQGREHPSQSHADIMKHDNPFEALAGAARAMDDTAETPASRVSEGILLDEELQSPATKRRKQGQPATSDYTVSEDVEELRRHIEQLQQENAQKDQRLMDMERMIAELDRKHQEGQRAQHEMFEQQQAAAAAAAIATAAQQA